MNTVIYDGSFEGLLTAIFDVYEYRLKDACLTKYKDHQKNIFGNDHFTVTDPIKSARVWQGLQQRISQKAQGQVYKTYLSEIKRIENTILSYVQYVFRCATSVEYDYSDPSVLMVAETANKVAREKHRMEAFVRFQLTKDQLYYATVQPDYNVLPLIIKHFQKRYADQKWMIYDVQRRYGIFYDLSTTEFVEMIFNPETENGKNIGPCIAEEETLYQQLWQQYFSSVNIAARRNMNLHIRHMPKRYWKFLIEKRPVTDK
ncbi:MAG: TIGR03915 family putative DNA repair protein [Chitinophagaceae bacterium]|nr:TIGR03915 family putative DNA repair protein [Chitinophagaceae bacterium]